MKKTLSLLLALILLFVAPPFAFAEEAAEQAELPAEQAELPAELFDLWNYGGESPVWVAAAIPVSEGILIAPASVKDIPPDQLAVTDGEHAWEAATVVPDEHSRFTLVFFDADETPARWGSWSLMPRGTSAPASSCTVRFGDSLGSRINRAVLASEDITFQGQRCLLLTLSDRAPAGSLVLTADGMIAGVVFAEWAEGPNRVLALPAEGIAESVTGVAGLLINMPDWSEPPEGLVVKADKNRVTIDWKDMTLPEKPEGSDIYMVLVDTGNEYLTSFPVEGQDSVSLLLTPGRFYIVGPVVSQGRPDSVPQVYASIFVPQAERLTDYGFKPVVTAIAEAPEGGLKGDEQPVPVPAGEVTEELLRSDRAYFYSHSTYEVTEEITGESLLITLTDPNGNNYRYESAWAWSPEYMAEDIWSIPLKEMPLTDALNAGGYPKGVYRIAYYVDGKLADEFTFELKQEQ